MSLKRMATGFAAMAAATFFAQALGFVVMVVLARRLTTDDIGAYSFALALAGYFAIPANFGVTALAIRDLAQRPGEAREIMGEVLSLQALICLVPYVLLLVLSPVLAPDPAARAILPIVGLTFVFDGLTFAWVLFGTAQFKLVAIARLAGALAFGAGSLLLVHAGPNAVTDLGWVTILGVAATGVITGCAALRRQGRPKLMGSVARLRSRFAAGAPLGVAAVMISIYYTIDSLMLGYIKGTATVGIYAIAYKIPLALTTVAALWGSVLFPHASALAQRSLKEVREQLSLFASASLIVSLPALAGAILVGHDLVPRLFGPKYAAGATPFILLMAAAALVLFTLSYGIMQIAVGDERHYALAVTLGAVTNVAINAVAIPLFGMVGAASATLAAEVVVFAYVYVRLRGILGPVPLDARRAARAAAATLIMVAVLLPLHELTVLVRVFVGIGVFAAAGAALKVIRPSELRAALRSEGRAPSPDPAFGEQLQTPDDTVVP